MPKIKKSFYCQENVTSISQQLLGKFLFTNINQKITGGMIVETEAYAGVADKASHAYNHRRTKRTEIMYAEGGVAYVYLCYGIHHLFNIVTNKKNIPHAILIRAIEPTDGIDIMLKRRRKKTVTHFLTSGPGAMSQALGIQTKHSGVNLYGNEIWLEDQGIKIHPEKIIASPRVGVHYAEADANLPWRLRIKDNPWCSKAK